MLPISRISPIAVQLPYYVEPAEDEALVSWLAHLSARFSQSPLIFGRTAFGIEAAKSPEWWRRPASTMIARISERTGLEPVRVEAMTFLNFATARKDEEADFFAGRRWKLPRMSEHRGRRIDICPRCIAEDTRPYLRRLWMIGWAGICPRHHIMLTGKCPSCQRPFRLKSLNAHSSVDLLSCRSCATHPASAASGSAHPVAQDLQNALLAAKQTGRAALPGIGDIQWASLVETAEMLLSMIWQGVPDTRRALLFNRIAKDIALSRSDRVALWIASNYSGLLLLGWLFENLPDRLPEAASILEAPRADTMFDRLSAVEDHVERKLRAILTPADRKPRPASGE